MSDRWPDKIVVGLTGNIATGKSVIMDLAAAQGALTLDADKIVHETLNNDGAVQAEVINAFGQTVNGADGEIDRNALAAIVFKDPEALQRLEEILHPVVSRLVLQRINASAAHIVFIEAIKLLEGNLAAECDQIWVASCPAATRIQRLVTFRGMDEETAKIRVGAQGSQDDKIAQADVVINTDGTMANTKRLFDEAWRSLTAQIAVEDENGN